MTFNKGRSRSDALLLLASVAMVLYLITVAFDGLWRGHIHTGDTDNLVAGARTALDCLDQGVTRNCGLITGTFHTMTYPYPLLQYLVAAPFIRLHAPDATVVYCLAVVSLLAFCVCILVMWRATRLAPSLLRVLAVAAIVGSSAAYQSTSGFGEMIGACAILVACATLLGNKWKWTFLTAFCACIAKETVWPFLLLMVIYAAVRNRKSPGVRKSIGLATLGVATAVLSNSIFNIFRFGSVVNRQYLEQQFRTTPNSRVFQYSAAVWFSPSSGILLFWPIFTVILVWTVTQRLRNAAAATGTEKFQDLLIVMFIGGLSLSLALWFTPFGWIAFGPRLAVPFMPALVLLLVDRWRDSEQLVRSKRGRVALLVVSEPLVVLGLFLAVSPWSWWPAVVRLMAPTGTCPLMTQLVLSDSPRRYYSCAERFMWRVSDPVLGRVLELHSAGSWIAFSAAVVSLLSACGWALMSNANSERAIEAAVQLESTG